MDDLETNTKFAQSLSADYPILSDPDKSVARAYGVLIPGVGVPNRWTFYIGADGKILEIDRKVKAATAGKDIAAALARLGVPRRVAAPGGK